jgi:hypothetical protein
MSNDGVHGITSTPMNEETKPKGDSADEGRNQSKHRKYIRADRKRSSTGDLIHGTKTGQTIPHGLHGTSSASSANPLRPRDRSTLRYGRGKDRCIAHEGRGVCTAVKTVGSTNLDGDRGFEIGAAA